MTTTDNNKNNTFGIEKFEGSFDKEEIGVTLIPTKTLNDIKNLDALGLYVFLLGRPPGWRLNVKHLKDHFKCSKDKIYSLLTYLMLEGFISKTPIRDRGKFVRIHYRVHLNRLSNISTDSFQETDETRASTASQPFPGFPDTVIPDAYITYNVDNIDNNKNTIVDSDKSTGKIKEYRLDDDFMNFYSVYPLKEKPSVAIKAFYAACKRSRMNITDFSKMVSQDVQMRLRNNWANRPKDKFPHPATYLNEAMWEGEIFAAEKQHQSKNRSKYKTMDEIIGDYL